MRDWPTTAPPLPKTNAAPSKTPSNTCARPTPPSTSRLSPRAGVQRKTVYKHRDLVAVIDQYRRQPTPPTSHRPAVKPASSRPCAPNWPQKTKRSKPSKQRRTNRNRPSPCSMDNSTYEPANTPRPLQTWHRNDRPTIPSRRSPSLTGDSHRNRQRRQLSRPKTAPPTTDRSCAQLADQQPPGRDGWRSPSPPSLRHPPSVGVSSHQSAPAVRTPKSFQILAGSGV